MISLVMFERSTSNVQPAACNMQPMRILKVNQTFAFFDEGGRTIHVRALARHLARCGHRLTVLTSNYGQSRRTGTRTIEGLEIVCLRSLAHYRTATLNPEVVFFCLRQLRDFQVVHIYGLYDLLGPVVAFFCRRWGIPYVLETMGMYRPRVRSLWKKQLYHLLLGRSLVRKAARIIATSENERSELIQAGLDPHKVILRRNGVELEALGLIDRTNHFRIRWGIPLDASLVLFLGRLVPIKSLDLLLSVFAALHSASTWLVLAGPEEGDGYRQGLDRMVTELGLSGRVLFPGPLYGDDKAAALKDADVFVLPSLVENFGIAAAEAMACGIPVIVTNRCGIAPYVEGQAGLVVPHDAEALRDALQRLLTDSSLCQRFRAQGPVVAQGLSWDEPVAQMEAIYQELIAESGQQSSG